MTEQKPIRDFWIEEWNNGDWHSSTCWQKKLQFMDDPKKVIHVVEKYAVDELLNMYLKLTKTIPYNSIEPDYLKEHKELLRKWGRN